MRKEFLVFLLCCSAVLGQDQAAQYFGAKAKPSNLGISCRVDEVARTVSVTIVNRTGKNCYFQRSGPLVDYEAVVTAADGKELPELTLEQAQKRANPSEKFVSFFFSTTLIRLAPREEYTGTFPLSEGFVLPKEGGKFRVRAGQGLFALGDNILERDPSEMIWCKPLDVTFPPLK